jgi:hypothetical protein
MLADQTDAATLADTQDATADMLAEEQESATSDAAHDASSDQTASVDEMLIGLNNYCSNSEFVGVTTGYLPHATVGGQFVFHSGNAIASFCDIVATGTEFGDPYIDVRFYGNHTNAFQASRLSLSEIVGGGLCSLHTLVTVSAWLTLLSPLPAFTPAFGASAGLKLSAGSGGSLITGAANSPPAAPPIHTADLPVGVRTYVSTTCTLGISAIPTPIRGLLSLSYPAYPTPFDVTVRISRIQVNFGEDVGYSPTNGPASQVAYRRPASDLEQVGWAFPTAESAAADTVQDAPASATPVDQTDTASPTDDQTATQDTTGDLTEASAAGADHPATAGFVSNVTETGGAAELTSETGAYVASLTEAGAALAEQAYLLSVLTTYTGDSPATDAPAAAADFSAAEDASAPAVDAPSSTAQFLMDGAEAGSAADTHDSLSGALVAQTDTASPDAAQAVTQGTIGTTDETGSAADTPAGAAIFLTSDAELGAAADAPASTYDTFSTQADAGAAGSVQDGLAGTFLEGTAVGAADAAHPALAAFAVSDAPTLAAGDVLSATAAMGSDTISSVAAGDAPTAGWVTLATVTHAGTALAVHDYLASTPADHTSAGAAGDSASYLLSLAAPGTAQTFAIDTLAGTVQFVVSDLAAGFADAGQTSGGDIQAQIGEAASLLEQVFAQIVGAGFVPKNRAYLLRQVAEEFVLRQSAVVTVRIAPNEEFVTRDAPEAVKVVLATPAYALRGAPTVLRVQKDPEQKTNIL